MKKLLMLLSGVALSSAAYASPVLNPAAPALNTDGLFYCCDNDCWSLRAGFRGDYVFDRKMANSQQSLDRYYLYANEGALTLNLWERLDVYGFVGAASQGFDTKFIGVATSVNEMAVDYQTKTIWGVGLKAVLLEWNWGCHCGTSFLSAAFDYESVNSASPTTRISDGILDNAALLPGVSYRETQVSLAWGHRIKSLVPYIGVKWSNARANMAAGTLNYLADFGGDIFFQGSKSQQHWGWVVGTSLVDAGRMTVSAEARFVDETAMTVTASFRF